MEDWRNPMNIERAKTKLDEAIAGQRWIDMVFVLYFTKDAPEYVKNLSHLVKHFVGKSGYGSGGRRLLPTK